MKWIAAMVLIAMAATAWVALAQGPAEPPPASGRGTLNDPALAALTTDIVILRAINNIEATPAQLRQLADLLGGLSEAETDLREQASRELTDERDRLLKAKPGEQPPPGEGLKIIRSLTSDFHDKLRDADTDAQEFLDADQVKAFRVLLAMTRGDRPMSQARDHLHRPKGAAPGEPEVDGVRRPGGAPPPAGDDRPLRERIKERMTKGEGFPRPPVPLQRVVELIEEKIEALEGGE